MQPAEFRVLLEKYEVCDDVLFWAHGKSAAQAYDSCECGDWLLEFAAEIGVDLKLIIGAACRCARLSLVYIPESESPPRLAVETAESWCGGTATIEEVRKVSRGNNFCRTEAIKAAEAHFPVAINAVNTIRAVYTSSYAAIHAINDADPIYAAYAALYAGDAAYYFAGGGISGVDCYVKAATARYKTECACADIVRSVISYDVFMRATQV